MVQKLEPLSVYEYVERAMCKDCRCEHILKQLAREIDLIWERMKNTDSGGVVKV